MDGVATDMAQFTVTGERNGKAIRVIWRDGKLTGNDPATLRWIRELAQGYEGSVQGLPGVPTTTARHLSSPYTAYAIIRSVFAGKTTLDRPLPKLTLPPGVVS